MEGHWEMLGMEQSKGEVSPIPGHPGCRVFFWYPSTHMNSLSTISQQTMIPEIPKNIEGALGRQWNIKAIRAKNVVVVFVLSFEMIAHFR